MKKFLYLITLSLCAMCYMLSYAEAISCSLSENLLRFHIISNSNSEYDTNIKLALRDYLSKNLENSKFSPKSKEYLTRLENEANKWLKNNGVSYRANAAYERCYIPKKSYKNITLPQGQYNALKLTLGEGTGENWWCVAYPSLCFTEAVEGKMSESGKKTLKKQLPPECYDIITDDKNYRFWIVDFISGLTKK